MLKIGDFSKMTQVSIRMLRHYDEIGLLKPAHIDPDTGYRFYVAAQLPKLNRILALQDLGFSLRQISHLLESELPPEQLRGMILQKQAEMEDRMRIEQERLARVRARLLQIENDDSGYDVIIKNIPMQWVASIRDRIGAHAYIGHLFDRLFTQLAPSGISGLPVVIWHDDSHMEDDIDAEAIVYLSGEIAHIPHVRVYQLPSVTMASIVHHGAYQNLPATYDVLTRWLDASGYQIAGANRELYLHYSSPIRQDDSSYITEIQFPIVRTED